MPKNLVPKVTCTETLGSSKLAGVPGQDTDDAQRATGVDEPLHTSAYWSMLETAVPDSRARIGPAEAFAVIRPPAPDRVGPTAQRMAPGRRKKAGEAHTISPLS